MEYFHSLELPVEGGDCPHTTSFTVPRSDWFRVLTRTPSYGSVSAFGVSFVEDGAYLSSLRVEGDFEGTITLRQDGGVELEGYNNGIVVTFSKAKNKDDSEYLFYEWRGDTDTNATLRLTDEGEIEVQGAAGNYTVTTCKTGNWAAYRSKIICTREYDSAGTLLSTDTTERPR